MSTGPKYPADVPRGYSKLELAAIRARNLLGVAPKEPLRAEAVMAGMRKLRIQVPQMLLHVDYHVADLTPGVLAETHLVSEYPGGRKREPTLEVALSTQTFADLERGKPRALFSLVHELGHVLLHCREVVRLSAIPHETAALLRGNYVSIPFYKDVEWQANGFAAACLMPATVLEWFDQSGKLSVDNLARFLNVSRRSAGIRINVFRERRAALLEVK